jgi:hypothetical protein
MTWLALSQLISQELQKFDQLPQLSANLPEDKTKWLAFYGKVERDNCASVAASVRKFARDRTWPHLSSVECYFLRERLRLLLPITMLLATLPGGSERDIPKPSPEPDDETFIEWALTANWEMGGRGDWLARVKIAIQLGQTV